MSIHSIGVVGAGVMGSGIAQVAAMAGLPVTLSNISADFRGLLNSTGTRARFAIGVFCYRVARHVGSLAPALGGVDALVFTAGIGENGRRSAP